MMWTPCQPAPDSGLTQDGELFGWGEARLGQLGCGKQSLVFEPQRISIKDDEDDIMKKTNSSINLKESSPRSMNPNGPCSDYRVKKVAAGFGHTAAITEDDSLFTWGLNVYGQLGIGKGNNGKKNMSNIKWKPMRVEKDTTSNWMPKIKDVACGWNFTVVIDCKFKW